MLRFRRPQSFICDIHRWDWVTWGSIFRMIPLDAPIGLILHCFFVFCNAADGIRVRGAFVVSDVPSPFCTEPAIVGANKTSLPSDRFHWTKDTVWKYVLYNPGMGKGSCQQYLCLFSIRATHQKTTLDKMQWSCQGPRCDSTFFPLIVAFCVLVIKNNNGLLSPTLAGSQAGTIRGRLIGRTGWGICWRRHGP